MFVIANEGRNNTTGVYLLIRLSILSGGGFLFFLSRKRITFII
nr:MAG TPA: hypothetical protein [Caudoviricetes sp.]